MTSVPDFKDRHGNWVATFRYDGKKFFTKSGRAYYHMAARCKKGGSVQKEQSTYVGCVNGFTDYQDFADWAVNQVGYDFAGAALDKDILFKGNRLYSKDTCVFVPPEINALLVKSNATRGGSPIGVCFDRRLGKYKAAITIKGRVTHIGLYETEEAAFQAYKLKKEAHLKEMAEDYSSVLDERAYIALTNYEVSIDD